MRWLGLGAGLLLVSCGGDGGYVWMDDDLPSENCPATEGAACETSSGSSSTATSLGTTTGSGGTCDATADCPSGFCAAPFDGEVGEFACLPGCIGIMDEALWCADAGACCDAGAVCTDRGYCVLAGSATGESGSDSGEASSGSSSGTTDGGSGESGSGDGGSGTSDGSGASSGSSG